MPRKNYRSLSVSGLLNQIPGIQLRKFSKKLIGLSMQPKVGAKTKLLLFKGKRARVVEFFSRGGFPPSRINIFYIGVLSIYALHKEALRFLDRSSSERGQKKGEMFVYIWVIMTAILYLINFTTKDYYSYSGDGKELLALTHISFIALEVGMVFVLARILKLLMIKYLEKNEN